MCLFVFVQLGLGRRMLCMITLSCECFNTLVTIVRSYLCVCQRVRVEISNSSANVVALVEICKSSTLDASVYASEGMVTFVCFLACMCHLVFLQLMCLCVSTITLTA